MPNKVKDPFIKGEDLVKTKLSTKVIVARVLTFMSDVEIENMDHLIKILVDNELYGQFVNEVKEAKTEA